MDFWTNNGLLEQCDQSSLSFISDKGGSRGKHLKAMKHQMFSSHLIRHHGRRSERCRIALALRFLNFFMRGTKQAKRDDRSQFCRKQRRIDDDAGGANNVCFVLFCCSTLLCPYLFDKSRTIFEIHVKMKEKHQNLKNKKRAKMFAKVCLHSSFSALACLPSI